MLKLPMLYNKRSFTNPCGDTLVDLTERAVSFIGLRSNAGQPVLIDQDTAMRPDLIAHKFYGDSGKVDLLLKYNGYSNPFAIGENTVIVVPDSNVLNKFSNKPPRPNFNEPRKKVANFKFEPKTQKDKKRLEFLANRDGVSAPPVAPNVALDKGVKVANGQIVFGSDVTSVKKEDCPVPISRTKLIQTLIQNKIGG
jgi:hypothetical protein